MTFHKVLALTLLAAAPCAQAALIPTDTLPPGIRGPVFPSNPSYGDDDGYGYGGSHTYHLRNRCLARGSNGLIFEGRALFRRHAASRALSACLSYSRFCSLIGCNN